MVEKARVLTTTTTSDNYFDKEYEALLRCLSNGKTLESLFKERQESVKKEREEQNNSFLDNDDDDIDPDFENVFSNLKECGNSYFLEEEIDGIVTIIKYEDQEEEEYSCFERELDQEPKRKVSSGSRKENGVSNLSKGFEIESGNVSKLISGNKGGIFSGNNSVSNEFEEKEACTISEREFDQEPQKKVSSVSSKENGSSNLSKGVETGSGNVLKSNSGNNLISNEYDEEQEEASTSSEREFDQEPQRKLSSGSRNENGVFDLSKGVEIESGSELKSISSYKGGFFGSNSVNNKYEEQEQDEEDTCSEKECEQEPKRKLRSVLRKEKGVTNQSKGDGTKGVNGSKPNLVYKDGIFIGCDKVVNFGKDGFEPDYRRLMKYCEIFEDGSLVYKYKGYELAYWTNDEEVKFDGYESDESSDCQLIDSIEFYKNINVNEAGRMDGNIEGEWRRQLIANLKRPYDQEEYDRLWEEISLSKLKLHHKELRKGRELSCVTDTAGKSYLAYHPDLKIKFDESHDDKPKCLNLLRGYFFWLKNQVHLGSFKPWKEDEYVSIKPESC